MLTSTITEIRFDIQIIEQNLALYEAANFSLRADAIDFIEFHLIDRINGLHPSTKLQPELYELREQAELLKQKLERINVGLFGQLRENIRLGMYSGSSFREMIGKYFDIATIAEQDTTGYDSLDLFVNGLMPDLPFPMPTGEQKPEMVFYQKTPARIVLKMAELLRHGQDDVFYDIGSGLGQVTILINMLTGVAAQGIEHEPAYVSYAKECSSQLHLTNIDFISVDARDADYSEGTIFFLYTPFEGSVLQDVLDILQNISRKRAITICTYGPCSKYAARQRWLYNTHGNADDPDKLCVFRSIRQIQQPQ